MSSLPHNIRDILVDTTREFERLEEAEMLRVLGRTTLDAAFEEEDVEGDILRSLDTEEVLAYFDSAPAEPTEPSPANKLDEARNDFEGRVHRNFGEIEGYTLGHAELGRLSLLLLPKVVPNPDEASYLQLQILATDNGKYSVEKVIKSARMRMAPEQLPVTANDESIVLAAIRKLGEINLEIAVNGDADI